MACDRLRDRALASLSYLATCIMLGTPVAVVLILGALIQPAHPADGLWYPQISVSLNSATRVYQRKDGLLSEDACKMFLRSAQFYEDLISVAEDALSEDNDAKFASEPECTQDKLVTGEPIAYTTDAWKLEAPVVMDGQSRTFTLAKTFATEAECLAWYNSDDSLEALLTLAYTVRSEDANSTFGQPVCVRSAPY